MEPKQLGEINHNLSMLNYYLEKIDKKPDSYTTEDIEQIAHRIAVDIINIAFNPDKYEKNNVSQPNIEILQTTLDKTKQLLSEKKIKFDLNLNPIDLIEEAHKALKTTEKTEEVGLSTIQRPESRPPTPLQPTTTGPASTQVNSATSSLKQASEAPTPKQEEAKKEILRSQDRPPPANEGLELEDAPMINPILKKIIQPNKDILLADVTKRFQEAQQFEGREKIQKLRELGIELSTENTSKLKPLKKQIQIELMKAEMVFIQKEFDDVISTEIQNDDKTSKLINFKVSLAILKEKNPNLDKNQIKPLTNLIVSIEEHIRELSGTEVKSEKILEFLAYQEEKNANKIKDFLNNLSEEFKDLSPKEQKELLSLLIQYFDENPNEIRDRAPAKLLLNVLIKNSSAVKLDDEETLKFLRIMDRSKNFIPLDCIGRALNFVKNAPSPEQRSREFTTIQQNLIQQLPKYLTLQNFINLNASLEEKFWHRNELQNIKDQIKNLNSHLSKENVNKKEIDEIKKNIKELELQKTKIETAIKEKSPEEIKQHRMIIVKHRKDFLSVMSTQFPPAKALKLIKVVSKNKDNTHTIRVLKETYQTEISYRKNLIEARRKLINLAAEKKIPEEQSKELIEIVNDSINTTDLVIQAIRNELKDAVFTSEGYIEKFDTANLASFLNIFRTQGFEVFKVVANGSRAMDMVFELTSNPDFVQSGLSNELIQIIQRTPRYVLLLEELSKNPNKNISRTAKETKVYAESSVKLGNALRP